MNSKSSDEIDVLIIGGGYYGCMIALYLKKYFKNITIVEREKDLLLKASYNNQARIHNGYHYPRSFLTALRSHKNYFRFIKEFKSCVVDNYTALYAIASKNSKVTSSQFVRFCNLIGSPISLTTDKWQNYFNEQLVEEVFEVEEYVFDAGKLRDMMFKKLKTEDIKILLDTEIVSVSSTSNNLIKVDTKEGESLNSKYVINSAYAGINDLLSNSKLPILPFKYEFIEMPLVSLPGEFKDLSVTMLDGPFFGFLPFPDKKCHTLWHVRYAVRDSWTNSKTSKKTYSKMNPTSNSSYIYMIKDAQRYIPLLSKTKYIDSLFEIKTVLIGNENDDGRPILYRSNYGIHNFFVVMGGKIDNIYDVFDALKIDLA